MSEPPVAWQRADPWALPGVIVICAAAILSAGPAGAVAAVAAALGWILLATPYVATLGGLSLLAIGVEGSTIAIGLAGVALVLVGPVVSRVEPVRVLLGTVAATLALGVVAWLMRDAAGVLAGAATLVVLVGAIGYTIHRYALVRVAGHDLPANGGGHGE